MVKVYAVIVAAGKSRRMGGDVSKQLVFLSGRPVLARTLDVFDKSGTIEGIILVAPFGEERQYKELARTWGCRKLTAVVSGGPTRQESVRHGLSALPEEVEIVVVHDGARPLVKEEHIDAVVAASVQWGAATLAVPVKETVKEVDAEGFVLQTPERDALWLTQTPQAFRRKLLIQAHDCARRSGGIFYDDAEIVEKLCRHKVKVVQGSYRNIKLTTPEDLTVAEALLPEDISRVEG